MSKENENQTDEIVISETTNTDVIYSQDKAAIDMQISTAKAYPRNITRAVNNAIVIVTMDKDTANSCTYSVPRGGKPITGPSVHLAKILAQNWGNLRIEAKVVSTDQKTVTCQAIAFDLENNLAIKVEVKRSIMVNEMVWDDTKKKSVRTGKMLRMSDDMIVVTGNAGNSIALRNAVLSIIPRSIVDKVYNEAKKMITGDISDKTKLLAKRKQVFDGLKDLYNVTEAEILSAIGKASVSHVDADDLVVIIGIAQAIKDNDTTVEEAFKKPKAMSVDEKKAKMQEKGEQGKINLA
jgi:hypothetical protein